MVTALLIGGAALVVLVIAAVLWQCVNDPFMWLFHACCGTLSGLTKLLGLLLVAIWEGFGGSGGSE